MLRNVLKATGIDAERCAGLLGVHPAIFSEWLSGQRPVPGSMLPLLSTILGVPPAVIAGSGPSGSDDAAETTPAIWFKFRGSGLGPPDSECALLIRQISYFVSEIEKITERPSVGWKGLFEDIQARTDRQAPPREQGRQAARMFCASRGLDHKAEGIGELFRPNLRNMGIVVVESAFPESRLEGCSFFVGSQASERPCIFANNARTTWFRRNAILMHEVAHAIFDSDSAGAAIDLIDSTADDLSEERAEAFAREALAPKSVLKNVAQRHGLDWHALNETGLAHLVAGVQVEPRTVLRAGFEAGLLTEAEQARYSNFDISGILPQLTDHALSTQEYLRKHAEEAPEWLGKRMTTIPTRSVKLPSSYVDTVVRLMRDCEISTGKAAEFLMIDEDTLEDRFGAH